MKTTFIPAPKNKPHIFTLIILASLFAFGSSVFLPSLPQMAVYFDTSAGVIGLSVGVYLGASAIFQLIGGPISDNIGRRPVILGAVSIFTLASIGCVYAPSVEIFLVFRAIQAAGAIAMILARAIVHDTVPANKAGSQIAYVTMGMSIVPMFAPSIGGLLDTHFSWQASFWFCTIVGAAILFLVLFDLGETAPKSNTPILRQFKGYGELIRSPRFWGYSLASSFGAGAFFAYLGGAPFVGREVFNMNTSQIGMVFGLPAIGYFIGNFLSGRYSQHFGINKMALWGLLLSSSGAFSSFIISSIGLSTPITFFGSMIIIACGNGMTIPNAAAGMLSVRPHLGGTASGLGSSIQIGGGAAISAMAGFFLEMGTTEWPLVTLQASCTAIGLCAILYVIRRSKMLQV